MVIKTESCSFSEYRIYPGRGKKFVSKDGKTHIFLSKKNACLARRKIKAQVITWTTAWRRMNKKIKTDELVKKRRKRQIRVQRAIVGITLDDIRKKRTEKPEIREALVQQAQREIKERRQKQIEARRAAQPTKQKAQPTQVPKTQKAPKSQKTNARR